MTSIPLAKARSIKSNAICGFVWKTTSSGIKFFSARRIVGPFFGQVQASAQQAIESRRGVGQGNRVDTVFDFSAIAVVLAFDTGRVIAAFGCAGFVDATNRLAAGVLAGDDMLTAVS
jgi:hypothetical protein